LKVQNELFEVENDSISYKRYLIFDIKEFDNRLKSKMEGASIIILDEQDVIDRSYGECYNLEVLLDVVISEKLYLFDAFRGRSTREETLYKQTRS
jgi:hypothetical protein